MQIFFLQIPTSLVTTIHVFFGSLALFFGFLPIIFKKGGVYHRRSGTIYFWSMAGIAISSVTIFLIKPFSDARLFLMFIGLFSFYLTFSGIRAFRSGIIRNDSNRRLGIDLYAGLLFIVLGIILIIFCSRYFLKAINPRKGLDVSVSGFYILSLLYLLFGWFSMAMGIEDYRRISRNQRKKNDHNSNTTTVHISRMLSAYIATVTAFFVVNSYKFFPSQISIFILILPGAIGGLLINRYVSVYKRKTISK